MDSHGDIFGSGWLHNSSFCLAFSGQGSFHICLTKSVSGMLRCAHTGRWCGNPAASSTKTSLISLKMLGCHQGIK